MHVLLVDCRQHPWFPAYELEAALRAEGHRCYYVPRNEGIAAVARAVAEGPTLLITLQGSEVWRDWKPGYVRECRERGVATVLWVTEPVDEGWFVESAGAHDMVLHSIGGMVDRLKTHGLEKCFWMPLAFHDGLFQMATVPESRRESFASEIAFVGTLDSTDRQRLMKALIYEGFNVKWWGPPIRTKILSLPRYAGEGPLRAAHTGRAVYGPDYAAVAAAADVFLGLDGDPGLDRSWGCRLYWALGCGATYLCRKVPGLETVFEPGRHLDTFADEQECVAKARRLLNKPRARMRFSVQGRQEILANHTYQVRLRRMEEITTQVLGLRWR